VLNTKRYFIELAYNGTKYHGWQLQPNAITVQECLDKALSIYFRQTITTLGCGRTDTGVHAKQFFAHFNLNFLDITSFPKDDELQAKVQGINSLLPYDISVNRIFTVENEAHARFDAIERGYQYHIHFHKNPFKVDRSWLLKRELDVTLMNEAARLLFNYTDFSCFSKSHTQTFTNNCKITKADFELIDDELVFSIFADRFLRNMVRAIVGTLIRIGKKEISLHDLETIIESKNRSKAGQSVPACGLYLVSVKYPYFN
jgi:tRNA pseudouridine38-40 synthase